MEWIRLVSITNRSGQMPMMFRRYTIKGFCDGINMGAREEEMLRVVPRFLTYFSLFTSFTESCQLWRRRLGHIEFH